MKHLNQIVRAGKVILFKSLTPVTVGLAIFVIYRLGEAYIIHHK